MEENSLDAFDRKILAVMQAEPDITVSALAERPVQDYVTVLAERAVKKSLKRAEK